MQFAPPSLCRAGAAFLLLSGLMAAPAVAQPVRVVSDAGPAELAPSGARRARAVTVDAAALVRAGDAGHPILVEAAGHVVEARPTRVVRRDSGVSWFGSTADDGRVTMTLVAGRLFGRVVTSDLFMVIEPSVDGHVAYEPGPFPESESDAVPAPPDGGHSSASVPDLLFPDEMHLMVVYTPATAAALGASLPAFMQATEDVVNDVLQNSDVPARARLVHTVPLTYVESGNMGTDLARLRTLADGFMDEVHAARDAYSADLVAMIVQSAGANCGVAYLMDPIRVEFASSGFSVTLLSCAIGNLTFPHELGHNIGLRHDRFVDPSNTPFTYSHGFVNDDSLNTPPGRPGIRTTLAYNDQCTSQGGTCTRVPFYSGPDLTFAGQVLGDSVLAHNARAAASSLPTVAQFRAAELLAEDDGTTAAAPTWRRPHCPDPGDLSGCAVGDSVRFVARTVQTTSVGLHHLRGEAAHDAVLLLYEGDFDPAAPLHGLVGYAEPDTTAPAVRRLLLSAPFEEGDPYTLVVTGRTLADAGPFELDVFGPPGGGIVVPVAEDPQVGDVYTLGGPFPNPFRTSSTLTLVLQEAQVVRAEAFDVLGRRVALLHDGPVPAGAPVALTLDGTSMAPGAYLVRVIAESFAATARVTRVN